jgi:hypothetical protein
MTNEEQSEQITELNLYVELETSTIVEGKLFEDFVLVRPVLPSRRREVRKVGIVDFAKTFDDFEGNRQEVRAFLAGKYEPTITIN